MDGVTIVDHPLVQHKLTLLRDKTRSTKVFRELFSEIGALLCYEATRDLPLETVEVETPLAAMPSRVLAGKQLVLKVPGRTFLPRIGESFPIRFVTKSRSQTTVRIFDLEGRLVVKIYDSRFDGPASVVPGEYSQRNWDGRDSDFELVPAGMYVVHLQAVNEETGDVDSKTAPVVVATRLSQ